VSEFGWQRAEQDVGTRSRGVSVVGLSVGHSSFKSSEATHFPEPGVHPRVHPRLECETAQNGKAWPLLCDWCPP
jgi:hypothetical protein